MVRFLCTAACTALSHLTSPCYFVLRLRLFVGVFVPD